MTTISAPSARALYCISVIMAFEGGLVNDPLDPGGVTKYGISKRSYPNIDIVNLTVVQAQAIYFRDYWLPVNAAQLPKQLDLYVFDAAVNQGTHAALLMLQAACGVTQDGVMGAGTLSAAKNCSPTKYLAERAMRYASNKQLDRFGVGWFTRLFNLTSR